MIRCANCTRPYPEQRVPYCCPTCGGVFDDDQPFSYDPSRVQPELPGLWKFRHSFGLPAEAPQVYLGEGNTPLVWTAIGDREIALKLEYVNPTGSFKDRGSAVLVSFLIGRGVESAIEDSSGNAGASFAAYAARAGIQARVFIPDYASGPKRAQIEAYGAEVVRVPGPRSNAARAVRQAADQGAIYASHAFLPHGLAGFATIAYELVGQSGQAPGTVIAPVGHGSLLLGIARGFLGLQRASVIQQLPRLVGVQARACAPVWALSAYGAAGSSQVSEGETVAEGIRVRHPLRGDALLRAVEATQGMFLAVDEDDILPGRDQLARRGFYVEPTSAVVWSALDQLAGNLPEPIVLILTGSGLKKYP